MERRAALERERLAKIESEQLERRRRQAEADLAAAAAERAQATREAEQARRDAQAIRDQAARDKSVADAAVRDAEARRQAAEAERAQLRAELLRQLNLVLATRETARGLIVNMSDVLFDTGMATLKPGAREKLAKISGIVLAHPGLKLEVEGHTDSVGGEEYNQKLSESRAKSVRDYLIKESVNPDSITSRGFGKTRPVASNDTAAGRQQNRRVELVVTGEPVQGAAGAVSATIPPTHN
jgi:outer membrane protein OmpA-like peptidoglycan-associated protein